MCMCVTVSDLETSTVRQCRPDLGCATKKETKLYWLLCYEIPVDQLFCYVLSWHCIVMLVVAQ